MAISKASNTGQSNMDSLISEYCIYEKTIEKREAKFSPYPADMLPEIQDYLRSVGIQQLYIHQAEMFEAAQQKTNIIITTSTASGKTMSFLLPVLQEILRNPQTRAIFLYPTKALASDQLRAMQPILDFFGRNRISAGVYDGDTPVNERSRIRASANIILTNPDMFNNAFLPHHSSDGFNFIFSNLKFVVVDELHSFRGAFGSHLANVFRRLGRICNYYHSEPQYLCSSATIGNPIELAEKVCGREFQLIDGDGSPSPQKRYHLIQPPMLGDGFRKSVSSVTAQIVPQLTVERHSFIAFCKSRRAVEVILRESREQLKDKSILQDMSDLISGYRGGYKPKERKEIERKMTDGQLRGLVSTNALELGIDIGSVDTTVLGGFPGTRASFWQQAGRAGRGSKNSDTYLVLDNLPIDQYIAIDPEWLFSASSENAVIDPNNLYIQIAHIRAAAAELPLKLDDISVFPDLAEIIPVLLKAGELRQSNGKFAWCGKDFPAGDYNLRNMDSVRYQIINKADNSVLAETDEMQAFRYAHKGAIYMHDGQSYLVESLDTDNKRAVVMPVDDDYYTITFSVPKIKLIKEHQQKPLGRTLCHFGDIQAKDSITGYKKVQFHNHQNLGFQEIEPPLTKEFESEGVWIDIPENVVELFSHIRTEKPVNQKQNFWKDYFYGLGFALQNAAMMLTMTTSEDISADIVNFQQTDGMSSAMCLYDLYVGGLGYAEKAYDLIERIVDHAIRMVSGCSCKDGCTACVGDYHLDKRIVLWGLQNLLTELPPLKDIKIVEAPSIPIEIKPFSFENIEEEWHVVTEYLSQRGESLSAFISTIPSVHKQGNGLILHVQNAFSCEWVMDKENKMRLTNFLSHYIEAPDGFFVGAEAVGQNGADITDKLIRRYRDLVD